MLHDYSGGALFVPPICQAVALRDSHFYNNTSTGGGGAPRPGSWRTEDARASGRQVPDAILEGMAPRGTPFLLLALLVGASAAADPMEFEILAGNVALPLEKMNQVPADSNGCSEFERVLLKDLEITQKYMQRVMGKSQDPRLKSRAFHAQSHLLCGGILSRHTAFIQTLRKFHDRSGQA